MPTTTVDTVKLTAIINRCFDYSMDERFTPARQDKFRAHGKRLRGLLVNLLTARFDEGTQSLKKATAALDKVNDEIQDAADVLAKTAETIANIAKLVKVLDGLLNIAVSFI